MSNYLQQRWVYGETGERLLGLSNTQAYTFAAKNIENMTITSIGSLRAMNEYSSSSLSVTEDIIAIRDTKFKYSFIITATKVYSIDKDTLQVKANVSHGVSSPTIYNAFENFVVVGNLSKTVVLEVNTTTGGLGIADFFGSLSKPLRDRRPLKCELYKWITVTEYDFSSSSNVSVKKLIKLQSMVDPGQWGTDSTGKLKINGTAQTITRMYCLASTALTEKNFNVTNFTSGQYLLNFYEGPPKNLVIGNTAVSLTGSDSDSLSQEYFTTLSVNNLNYAKATTGIPIELNPTNVKDITVFQNRLCLITDTEIFFSEIFNYINFLNNAEEESAAFYIKPSPIRNIQPNLRRVSASKGLYINTDRGFYMLGYDNYLSQLSCFVTLVTDRVPTLEHMILEENLYFIDPLGVVYCSRNKGDASIQFETFEVDRFDIKLHAKYLSSIQIDGTEYIALIDSNIADKVYLYRELKTDEKLPVFPRTSYVVGHGGKKFLGWHSAYVLGRNIYRPTQTFMGNLKVGILPPPVQTKEKGLYMNNSIVQIKSVVVNTLNEDSGAVKQMKINGVKISNIAQDIYNTYVCYTSFPMRTGFEIEIELNGNDKVFEVLGVEQFTQ